MCFHAARQNLIAAFQTWRAPPNHSSLIFNHRVVSAYYNVTTFVSPKQALPLMKFTLGAMIWKAEAVDDVTVPYFLRQFHTIPGGKRKNKLAFK